MSDGGFHSDRQIKAAASYSIARYSQKLERSINGLRLNGEVIRFVRHKWVEGDRFGPSSLTLCTIGSLAGRSGYFKFVTPDQVLKGCDREVNAKLVRECAGRVSDSISLLKLAGVKRRSVSFLNRIALCESCEQKLSIVEFGCDSWMCGHCRDRESGYVYVMSNPSLDYLKVGYTENAVEKRAEDLSKSTSIPTPFDVERAVQTLNPKSVEQQAHRKLDECRVSDGREFFDCTVREATSAIEASRRELDERVEA